MGLMSIHKFSCLVCASLSMISITAFGFELSGESSIRPEKGGSVEHFKGQRRHKRAFEWNYDDWPYGRVDEWVSNNQQRPFYQYQTWQQDDANDEVRLEDLHKMPTEDPQINRSQEVVTPTPEPETTQPTTVSSAKRRPFRPPTPPRQSAKDRRPYYSSSELFDKQYAPMAAIANMLHQSESERNRDYYHVDRNEDYGCAGGQCSESVLPLVALSGIGFLLLYLVAVAPVSGKRKKRNSLYPTSDIEAEDYVVDTKKWVWLVDDLWNAADESDPFTTLKALQRMNLLASHSPKPVRELLLLSSVPLSYLLYKRNNHGFTCYLSAGLTGQYETDCIIGPNKLLVS